MGQRAKLKRQSRKEEARLLLMLRAEQAGETLPFDPAKLYPRAFRLLARLAAK